MSSHTRPNNFASSANGAAIALTSIFLGACATPTATVRIPATDMPVISTNTVARSGAWPIVKTIEGSKQTLTGPITGVQIEYNRRIYPVAFPFSARISGENLEISTDIMRPYRLTDVSLVAVHYDDLKAARTEIGTGLVLGSLPLFVIGGIALYADSDCQPGGVNFCGMASMLGAGFILIGLGFAIPGFYIGATDPTPPPAKTARIRPELRIGPSGAALTATF